MVQGHICCGLLEGPDRAEGPAEGVDRRFSGAWLFSLMGWGGAFLPEPHAGMEREMPTQARAGFL